MNPEQNAERETPGERTAPAFGDEMTCRECGSDVWIDDGGCAYHWGSGNDSIDHDLDADHVAVPDEDDDAPQHNDGEE